MADSKSDVRSLDSPRPELQSTGSPAQPRPLTWGRLSLIVAIVFVLPSLLGQGNFTKRAFDSEPLNELRQTQPQCVFVGDSMLETRIDPSRLSDLSKLRTEILTYPGTGTAQWYLILKNYVTALPKNPDCVVLFFRDRQLTIPGYHTTGRYRRRTEALMKRVEPAFERVLENAVRTPDFLTKVAKWLYPIQRVREEFQDKALVTALGFSTKNSEVQSVRTAAGAMFNVSNLRDDNNGDAEADDDLMAGLNPSGNDFSSEVGKSFLPEILSLARSKNVRLVFFRVKRRPSEKDTVPDPSLQQYISELEAYLARNGVKLVDESKDASMTVDYYTTDDHISKSKTPEYTERFWKIAGSLIAQPQPESAASKPL